MEMERASALVFHRYKMTLSDGQEVIPGPALPKATAVLTLRIPQNALDSACRDAEEPFALSRSEFVNLCVQFEHTCVDLVKLREDLEVVSQHSGGKVNREKLQSVLLCANGDGCFDSDGFNEFFDLLSGGGGAGGVSDGQQQVVSDYAEIDDVLAVLDPFRLTRLLDALEVDETSGRNFTSMRSEPMDRQLILDQEERDRAQVPERERQGAERRAKEDLRRNSMPPVPATVPVLAAKPKQTAAAAAAPEPKAAGTKHPSEPAPPPPVKPKAKSGCC
jgi:hypothetical protein